VTILDQIAQSDSEDIRKLLGVTAESGPYQPDPVPPGWDNWADFDNAPRHENWHDWTNR
jgi:hypothetical protein